MGFLSGFMLWGMALASVPVIIHLLNRRRFRYVDWAPMEYLKLTLRTNRKRMRLEQLLLLLLRTLAIIALVMMIARPVVSESGLGAWIGGRNRVSQFIVLDDTLSMGYKDRGRPAMAAARVAGRELVERIGSQDTVTLLLASAPTQPLIDGVHLDGPTAAREGERIAQLPVTHSAGDWGAIFKSVDQRLQQATYPIRQLTLITDLRQAGWTSEVSKATAEWAKQGVRVRIVNVGATAAMNITLTGLRQEGRVVLRGKPAQFQATIRNDTSAALVGLRGVLTVDGKSRTINIPELAPRQETKAPLSILFSELGEHSISFSIGEDELNEDNQRWLTIEARDRLRVTLVDGEPSNEPYLSEMDYLANVLASDEMWQIRRVIDTDWKPELDKDADLIILGNVAEVNEARAASLRRHVEEGAGLMIFVGDLINTDRYNRLLWQDGEGLLPARLGPPVEVDASVRGLIVESLDDSPLAITGKLDPAARARVQITKYLEALDHDKSRDSRIVARWNDADRRPALLEKRVGRGKVLLWTTTADQAWGGDWMREQTTVLAIWESTAAIARGSLSGGSQTSGQPLIVTLAPDRGVTGSTVNAPGDKDARSPSVKPADATGPAKIQYSDTRLAGLYEMNWKDTASASGKRLFSVNPDVVESDLAVIETAALKKLFGPVEVEVIAFSGQEGSLTGKGREIWRNLGLALLAMFALETVMAWWVSRER